jgi:hypothetical protein
MTNKSNASLLMQGYSNLVTGRDTIDGGLAQMVLGWLPVLDTPLRWSIGEGAEAVAGMFSAAEYVAKPLDDTKKQGVRLAVIGTDLLGRPDDVEPMSGALKGDVTESLRAAVAVRAFYINRSEQTGVTRNKLRLVTVMGASGKRRSVIAGIPAGDMFDLLEKQAEGLPPKLNAKGRAVANTLAKAHRGARPLTDAQLIERVLSAEVACDGAIDRDYGRTWTTKQFCAVMFKRAIAAGLLPEPKSRGGSDDVGEHAVKSAQAVKNFSAKIEQVRDWLTMCNAPNGEVQIAPTKEQEAVLDMIAEQWAAYRSSHPILF